MDKLSGDSRDPIFVRPRRPTIRSHSKITWRLRRLLCSSYFQTAEKRSRHIILTLRVCSKSGELTCPRLLSPQFLPRRRHPKLCQVHPPLATPQQAQSSIWSRPLEVLE